MNKNQMQFKNFLVLLEINIKISSIIFLYMNNLNHTQVNPMDDCNYLYNN